MSAQCGHAGWVIVIPCYSVYYCKATINSVNQHRWK
jgi:hypothetical protein